MKAIILAAGIGQRLGNCADNKPKCLLEFGGISLLNQHLQTLKHFKITEIIVVTGYQANMIEDEILHSVAHAITRTIYNPDYQKGSLISLMVGLEAMEKNDDLILMDADVLYDQKIIACLVDTKIPNCFLLDRDFIPGEEPVKLCVRNGQLVDFRKQIDKNLRFDFQGESVGFFRFSADMADNLVSRARYMQEQGLENEPYEELIRTLLLEQPDNFGYEDITGIRWIEIDFPEDVKRAASEILPHIQKVTN